MNDKYYTKTEACKRLGISLKKFDSLNLIIDKIEKNQYCDSKFMYLYDKKKIDSLVYSSIIRDLKQRKKKAKNNIKKDRKYDSKHNE